MNMNLIVCISGIALWLVSFLVMNSKINAQKKILSEKGKAIPKAETSFGASLSLSIFQFLRHPDTAIVTQ